MSFIGQSAPDIQVRLQRLEGLQGYTLPDLVKEAEKIFNKREMPEEREDRLRWEQDRKEEQREKRRGKELTRILATVVSKAEQGRTRSGRDPGDRQRPRLDREQCALGKRVPEETSSSEIRSCTISGE